MMRQKQGPPSSAEKTVKDIRRATRKRHATEEKVRIVLDGLRGEYSTAELCRREGIAPIDHLSMVYISIYVVPVN